ncbi:uncharacterized protein FOMMEDRAFT_170214 [Fomitiporia mediterranea MF3/22]|uniref:uncharacterized protein n=1 Tax=Fomitiporia mediterranea (strain MF3/22) TaxID=694068 RepID=UPI0004408B77|nr:uncharacterized protein FOMMEDRAFT_170214 [Fomitiporia mediterranea MF3/22]EJD00234.1 hypothetical protein FOMMEDRAFT_170214 [Fomitiporia mediterranea MF3/22]
MDAKNVILDIRNRYKVDEDLPSDLLEITEQALELLSEQLYSTDTHFIMEFVQNADDNEYEKGIEPTLRILADKTSMTLSCNEKGFYEKNVRAICKIGGSTKKNNPGFIGEKGIGFKSVFKVADIVNVASGPFTFKFDRSKRLGMITPIWDPSVVADHGWTTFYLDLSRSPGSGTAIGVKLDEIKPSLLLFLRKLRAIEVDIRTGSPRQVEIKRRDLNSDLVQLTRIANGTILNKNTYFVVRQCVDMSSVRDDRRKDIKETEVVLAFPVDDEHLPQIFAQDVHAFLPVRDFGFKFVINGDFLTSSSREDVLHDSPWNQNIRRAIIQTFITAVRAFQTQGTLQDLWIRFLPSGIVGSFFKAVERDLLRDLREMNVVRDSSGAVRRPCQVLSVPSTFRYDFTPLVPARFMERSGFYYLSDNYDMLADGPILKQLGVREMTVDDLLTGLQAMSSNHFMAHNNRWHDAVCSQLLHVAKRNKKLQGLKILPLDDGSWAATHKAGNFVFDCDMQGIPAHIDLRRIHSCVCPSSSPTRHTLFRHLGVGQADPVFIAEKILSYQGRLPVQAHITNAKFFFMYHYSNLPSPAGRLRFADEQGNTDTSDVLYLDLPSDQGRLRQALPSSARFIHPEYMLQYCAKERDEWLSWLQSSVRLNLAPRIVNDCLSPEFEEMSQRLSLSEFLDALRYFWPRLSTKSPFSWLGKLGSMTVKMDNNSDYRLNSTFLKRRVLAQHPELPFLPVSDPESRGWDFLGRVGVTIAADTSFYVKLLIHHQLQGLDDQKTIKNIYKQLDARFYEDTERIRDAFNRHPLVFAANFSNSSKGQAVAWLNLSEVYWDGPSSMTSKIALRSLYPDLREFFQEKLGLPNAPPEVLVDELKTISREWLDKAITNDVHRLVTFMLIDLARLLKANRLDYNNVHHLLQESMIFPSTSSLPGIKLQKLADIFIPDHSGFYTGLFRGKAPILELASSEKGAELARITYLLELAKSEGLARYLQCSLDHQVVSIGDRELDEQLTAAYTSKYRFFERLVYSTSLQQPSQYQLEGLSKVQEMRIYMVNSITSTFTLDNVAPITTDSELLHVDEEDSFIRVLISRKACNGLGASSRAHRSVCKRLSGLLNCKYEKLLLCMKLEAFDLDEYFQEEGIDKVTSDAAQDNDSWMTSNPTRVVSTSKAVKSLVKQSNRYQPTKTTGLSMEVNNVAFERSIQGQDIQKEIDDILGCFSELSISSARVVGLRPSSMHALQSTSEYVSTESCQLAAHVSNKVVASVQNSRSSLPVTSGTSESTRNLDLSTDASHSILFESIGGSSSPLRMFLSPEPSQFQQMNGVLGERYVYELLLNMIGPTFGPDNWTSELRGLNPGFDGFEGPSIADFRFEDQYGILTELLFKGEPEMFSEEWYPTYHIEVKSTSSGSHEPFHLSKRQFDTALRYSRIANGNKFMRDIYVIIRVWNIRRPTANNYAIYVDPLCCMLDGRLKVVSNLEMMMGDD